MAARVVGPPALHPRQQAADALLAIALSALSVALLAGLKDVSAAAYPLALCHTLPLAVRRRMPVAAAFVAFTAALAYALFGVPVVGLGPAALVWLYTVGSDVAPPASHRLLGAAGALVLVMTAMGSQGDASTGVGNAVALTVAYLLGDAARRRRRLLELHKERADQLERTQLEAARRAVAEERLRIARELHDVVAHSMSVIAVQAGTGRLVIDSEPDRARESLAVIERTSRSAMDEMRRLLGVLRSDDAAVGTAPAPGLDAVDDLLATTVAAGVPVEVRTEGERGELPLGLELAAYRILQEALTNVARHAAGARARVRLSFAPGSVALEVVNTRGTVSASPPRGMGLGLVGMRERAAVYGGVVEARPLPDGGFRVATTLSADRGGSQ